MEKVNIPDWLKTTGTAACPSCAVGKGKGFIEKNIEAIAAFIKEVLEPEGFANKNGLLQQIDPRARLLGTLLLMLAAAVLKSALPIAGLLLLIALMSIISKINFAVLFKRVMPLLIFTLFLVLPTAFSFITPGAPVVKIFDIYISKEGLENIFLLLLRVAAMTSLVAVFILSTGYPDMFRALQSFPIPKFFVSALSMTFRYIMVLIKVAEDSHLAKKARTIKSFTIKEGRGWLASRIWLILERSLEMAEDVYLAMTARGFMGKVKTMTIFEIKGRDYIWMGFAIFILLLAIQL